MAPAFRLLIALGAPSALLAFVHPGAFLTSAPRSSWLRAQPTSQSYKSRRISTAPTNWRSASGVGALHAGNKENDFDVTAKPGTNSSMILTLDIPGRTTRLCYDRAVREMSKASAGRVPGYSNSKNEKIPPQVIERLYGIEEIKGQALKIVSDRVINEAIESFDFKAIGSAELVQDAEVVLQYFTPGEPLMLEVKVDIWPSVKFKGDYSGFDFTVEEPPKDVERIDAAWKALQERNVVLEDTDEGYAAKLGDSVIANMVPYAEKPDGSIGGRLPEIASGEMVDIVMEEGRYMPGLAEGMEGVKAGEKREIRVTFPDRLGPSGADLEGTKAVFEVEAVEVKKRRVPEVNEEFAKSIRKDLTIEDLTKEVETAVMEESGSSKKDARNRALEDSLLEVTDVEIPETLIIEQAREKFAIMMTEFKDQGESDEKVKSMITKENFAKYVEVVRKNTTRALSLGLVFTQIAEDQELVVDSREVEDQMDLMKAQAKGEEVDEVVARDKIEASIQRDMVLDWVAERSTISWVEGKPLEKQPMPVS